jgi:hypothetical protein
VRTRLSGVTRDDLGKRLLNLYQYPVFAVVANAASKYPVCLEEAHALPVGARCKKTQRQLTAESLERLL